MSDTPESLRLEITKGQHWVEDGTDIRYEVIYCGQSAQEIKLSAADGRRRTKTVSLGDLLAGFTQCLSKPRR